MAARRRAAGAVDALRPAAVIFSAGRDNRFGHPAAAVVARYREPRAELFSTAKDGAVFSRPTAWT